MTIKRKKKRKKSKQMNLNGTKQTTKEKAHETHTDAEMHTLVHTEIP